MKTGMKSILGLGFLAAMAGLSQRSMEINDPYRGLDSPFILQGNTRYGSPAYYGGKSNRKKKSNRLRLSHNAKLKRRKSA